jgi:putative heme-binding domain-containing protein
VRRNAALVLPRTAGGARALVESGILRDPDGEVRLAGLLALSEMPASPEAAAAAVAALGGDRNLRDEWLADAATCAAAAHDVLVLEALARGDLREAGERAISIIERVAEHHARGAPGAKAPGLLASFAAGSAPADVSAAVVAGLARGWPRDAVVPLDPPAEEALTRLFRALPPAARGQLVGLTSRWGSDVLRKHAEEIGASLLAAVLDEARDEKTRVDAARQLMEFERTDPAAAGKILDLITVQTPPELAAGLLDAVGASEAPGAGDAVIERLPSLTPAVRPAAFRILLGKTAWTRALLEAMGRGDIRASDLSLDQRQALTAHPDRRVAFRARRLLRRSGGLPSDDREDVLRSLLPVAEKRGDPTLGKAVYLKQCAKCHVHGDEGTRIGPDLTGMAVHPKAELLTQIIDPNRSLEGNFRVYAVVTRDGRALTGLLHSESRTAIELFDSDGKKHVVLREDVAQLAASSKSLMPEGFEKEIPPEDLTNLLEFLVQRGRYLPIPLAKAATAVSTRGLFTAADAEAERFVFPDWSPKVFEGIPFHLIDPQGDRVPNVILLHGPQGALPPRMPRSVKIPLNAPAKAIHFLGGVSGWGFPFSKQGTVSLIVRLWYEDGSTEDHPLVNGEHFAGYNRRIEVPGSKLAFLLERQQVRYLSVAPGKTAAIREVELVKGEDETAPVVIAVTAEAPPASPGG